MEVFDKRKVGPEEWGGAEDEKGSHKKHFAAGILKILHPTAYLTSSDDAEF